MDADTVYEIVFEMDYCATDLSVYRMMLLSGLNCTLLYNSLHGWSIFAFFLWLEYANIDTESDLY